MMDKYLLVFLSIEDNINPDPNLHGASTMLHCCLQTLIVVPLSRPSANKLPSATAKYFTFGPISPEHLLPSFCSTVPMFSCTAESLGLVSMWEVWLLTRCLQTVVLLQETCVYMQTCLLPCSFHGGNNAVIHWMWVSAGERHVHTYYNNEDQLTLQEQSYRNRTSLFKDLISRGNASLQLTGVKVQDQGRYKCYTSTFTGNKESFINLEVDAPVGKVDLQQVENRIICSSQGIYPQPELTWSTSPSSNVTLQNQTTIQQTEQLLYSISSSLTRSDSDSDLSYSCTISTGRNRRTVTLRKLPSVGPSSTETTIPCSASNTSESSSHLVWRFNDSQIILNQTRADTSPTVSDGWRQQVKGVSESGSLMLKDLTPHHEGIYTCEASDAEETVITNIFLRIEKRWNDITIIIIISVVVFVVILVLLVLMLIKKFSREKCSVPAAVN